jgi:hypothetical protein
MPWKKWLLKILPYFGFFLLFHVKLLYHVKFFLPSNCWDLFCSNVLILFRSLKSTFFCSNCQDVVHSSTLLLLCLLLWCTCCFDHEVASIISTKSSLSFAFYFVSFCCNNFLSFALRKTLVVAFYQYSPYSRFSPNCSPLPTHSNEKLNTINWKTI